MGGEASAVSGSTAEVFLEAAWFNPSAVAGRARRFALSSDAAFRFERGVDFAATPEAIERATRLVLDVCGGAAGPVSEATAALPQRNPVRLRSSRASKIIGVQFSDEQIAGLLKRLQLPYARSGGEFTVTPPSYRFDLDIEEDMVDGVRGFEAARCFLRRRGDEEPRDPARAVAGYHQPVRIGGLAYGPAAAEQWGIPVRPVDFYDIKGDVEALLAPREARFTPLAHPGLHPGRAASVVLGGASIGWLGELHPRWQRKYDLPRTPVLFELDVAGLAAVDVPRHREISKFPPVIRDRSMEFDEAIPVSGILEELTRNRPPLVQDIRLFDFYRGKGVERGKKSLAFRVVMQDTARTLTDAEADAAMAQLTELLAAKFGAKLRT